MVSWSGLSCSGDQELVGAQSADRLRPLQPGAVSNVPLRSTVSFSETSVAGVEYTHAASTLRRNCSAAGRFSVIMHSLWCEPWRAMCSMASSMRQCQGAGNRDRCRRMPHILPRRRRHRNRARHHLLEGHIGAVFENYADYSEWNRYPADEHAVGSFRRCKLHTYGGGQCGNLPDCRHDVGYPRAVEPLRI